MLKSRTLVILLGLAVLVVVAATGPAEERKDNAWGDIPAKARAALIKLAGDARITEMEREREHGVVLYEAEWVTAQGREQEAVVTAEGDLVEIEEEVSAGDVPATVQAKVAKLFPGAARFEYEKVMIVAYEIEATVDGREREVLVTTLGTVLGQADEDDDDGDDDD